MIRIENVVKRFDDIEALKGIDLQIEKGSIYGIVGTNGAGKTTLLKCILGIYKVDKGKITVENEEIYENANIKSKMFFIPDNPYFFRQFSVLQMANFYKGIYPQWNQKRFENLKKIFKLDINRKIIKFSKGMQKQAVILLALSTMPDIFILDEPFDGLDPLIRQTFKSLIINDVAEREMTVLISSHNLRELEDFCDHIAVLHSGKVVVEKDIDDLKQNINKIQAVFKENFDINCLSEFNILSYTEKGSIKNIVIKGDKQRIIQTLSKYQPVILEAVPLTLEEIFIYEMGGIGYEIKNIID